jgi:acyl-CoA thioester hydrolase
MTRTRLTRADYRHFERFTSRWRDNDVYGHVNNAVYYEYVDTLVNGWLIAHGGLDMSSGETICLVAETGCTFHESLAFPAPIEAGLRLDRLGRSSITCGIGLFRLGAERAAATARFVHVCVSRDAGRPVDVPGGLRLALAALA